MFYSYFENKFLPKINFGYLLQGQWGVECFFCPQRPTLIRNLKKKKKKKKITMVRKAPNFVRIRCFLSKIVENAPKFCTFRFFRKR